MKRKNVKYQTAQIIAEMSLKLGQMSVDSACIYIYHQPKIPEALKNFKLKTK